MGKIEVRVRKRVRKQNIRYAVLTALKVVGVASLLVLAPNALRLLKYAPGSQSIYRTRIKASLKRLESKGFVTFDKSNGGKKMHLTQKGEALLARLSDGASHYRAPEKWDGQWRIVIFDVKECRRSARNDLRHMLVRIGFKKLQESVWVFPHDCEELIDLLKAEFSLGKEVLYIVTEEIEGAQWLRRVFRLPPQKRQT